MKNKFTARARMHSFTHAFAGIWTLVATQHNAWIHLATTVMVVACGLAANLSALEWCVMVFAVAGVWMAEAFNTALEFLADAAHPGFHPLVKKAKDAAAGAVLLAAIGAAVAGAVVFGSKLCK